MTIKDTAGEVLDDRYLLANPIDPVDCLEVPKCQARERHGSDEIDKIRRLRFVDRRLGGPRTLSVERAIFRPEHFHRITLIDRALAASIDAAGLTGFRWQAIDDFPGRAGSVAASDPQLPPRPVLP